MDEFLSFVEGIRAYITEGGIFLSKPTHLHNEVPPILTVQNGTVNIDMGLD